jgi:hypothetical protein
MSRSSISIDRELADELKELKERGDMTYTEVIQFLMSFRDFRTKKSGANKAEIRLKNWLALGGDGEITAVKLKNIASVNYNTCKQVIELYQKEVDLYNQKFK